MVVKGFFYLDYSILFLTLETGYFPEVDEVATENNDVLPPNNELLLFYVSDLETSYFFIYFSYDLAPGPGENKELLFEFESPKSEVFFFYPSVLLMIFSFKFWHLVRSI